MLAYEARVRQNCGMSYPERIPIHNELLQAALEEARATDFESYKKEQLNWLEANSPLALIAINGFKGGEDPIPLILGTSLGVDTVRRHINAGEISRDEVVGNHTVHYLDKKLVVREEITDEQLYSIFSKKVADTVSALQHPRVRTFSSLMLITSFRSEATSETRKFLKLPTPVMRRHGSSTRISGRSK
jgi:hypothetical protein